MVNPIFQTELTVNGITYTINNFTGPGWLLIYDDENVRFIGFIDDGDTMQSKWYMFAADTKSECEAEISRLGLNYDPYEF